LYHASRLRTPTFPWIRKTKAKRAINVTLIFSAVRRRGIIFFKGKNRLASRITAKRTFINVMSRPLPTFPKKAAYICNKKMKLSSKTAGKGS
jgi:hypothetical protein